MALQPTSDYRVIARRPQADVAIRISNTMSDNRNTKENGLPRSLSLPRNDIRWLCLFIQTIIYRCKADGKGSTFVLPFYII